MNSARLLGRLLAYGWRKWIRSIERWLAQATCEHDIEWGNEPDAVYIGLARCRKCGRIWYDVDDI